MRYLSLIIGLLIVTLVSFSGSGCSDPKPPPINPADTNFYVSAKVNGVAVYADRNNLSGLFVVSDLRIIGREVKNNQIQHAFTLNVQDFIGPGTYMLNAENVCYYQSGNSGLEYSTNAVQNGNMVVSEFKDGIIVGTFLFQARSSMGDMVAVSEGKFRVPVSQ